MFATFGRTASAETWLCVISSKFSCTAEGGCQQNQIGMWNEIDLSGETFARCDRNGCDRYPMEVSRSGMYYVFDIPGRGMLAKMLLDGSEYVEVVTLGTMSLVSFGTCKQQ
jgi:hypothetical protein